MQDKQHTCDLRGNKMGLELVHLRAITTVQEMTRWRDTDSDSHLERKRRCRWWGGCLQKDRTIFRKKIVWIQRSKILFRWRWRKEVQHSTRCWAHLASALWEIYRQERDAGSLTLSQRIGGRTQRKKSAIPRLQIMLLQLISWTLSRAEDMREFRALRWRIEGARLLV